MIGKYDSVILLSAGVGLTILTAYYLYKRKKVTRDWKLVGYLSQINFFPVKSCSVVYIDEAECKVLGLKRGQFNDRTFMLTDENGNYQTGRSVSNLVQIKPKIINDHKLVLTADNMTDFLLDLKKIESLNNVTKCKIWNDVVNVIDCGNEAAKWVSNVILKTDSGLKLVYYPHKNSTRSVRKKFTVTAKLTKKDCGAFADGSSYMLASLSSLDALNSQLTNNKIEIHQFRPNFVVKESEPHDEDNWKMVKIGNNTEFEVVLPCTRCNFVNVDPNTGLSNDLNEPLKTLKRYRQVENKNLRKIVGDSPKMGIQMALSNSGKVKVGDPVYAIY